MDKGIQFPWVTVPDFEVQASNSRELSDTDLLAWCPLVPRDEAQAWGDYVTENQGWYLESLEFLGMSTDNIGLVDPQIRLTRNFDDPNYNQGLHPDLMNRMAPTWYVKSLHDTLVKQISKTIHSTEPY